jgi:hypothetical protein
MKSTNTGVETLMMLIHNHLQRILQLLMCFGKLHRLILEPKTRWIHKLKGDLYGYAVA